MKLKPFYYLLFILCLLINFGIYHCNDKDDPINPIQTPSPTFTLPEVATKSVDFSSNIYVYYRDWEFTPTESKELYFVQPSTFFQDSFGYLIGNLSEELKFYDQYYISAEGVLYPYLDYTPTGPFYLGKLDIQSYEIIHE
jgi:hypothetical protein